MTNSNITKDELKSTVKALILDKLETYDNDTMNAEMNRYLTINKILQKLIDEHYIEPKDESTNIEVSDNHFVEIYVDGSYNQDTEEYAYGVTVLLNDCDGVHPIYFRKKFAKSPSSSMRNVAGEIEAARFAITFAVKHNFKKCRIVYDYQGIECWALGKWKTNKAETKAYKDFYDMYKDICEFEFLHVKGHTGVVDNEICDALAKSALGIHTLKKYDEIINQAITN